MAEHSPRRKVAGSALTTPHFMLLFAAMLVAAAGNTALHSVMPAIGRAMQINDLYVAIGFTSSAVLWVALAPYWARMSDRHGRKALTLLGVGGFIVSMALCGLVLAFGLAGALSALSSSFGLGTIVGPALAPLFVLPFVGLPGPLLAFAMIAVAVFVAILAWLPDDSRARHGERRGHGAAMSYPSIASSPTGASVVASTAPRGARLKWNDRRIRNWIIAGVVSGHAQAAVLTCLGFFVIDRLGLAPRGSEQSISIVMMAGAAATLAAQWGIIPRLGLSPRAMILWGSLIAAAGTLVTMVASDLYGLVLGFGVASLGFGFTRPGFTGGASLAVPLAEQGGVAGVITAANGIAYVAAPTVGMALYAIDPHWPFALSAALLVALVIWGHRALHAAPPSA